MSPTLFKLYIREIPAPPSWIVSDITYWWLVLFSPLETPLITYEWQVEWITLTMVTGLKKDLFKSPRTNQWQYSKEVGPGKYSIPIRDNIAPAQLNFYSSFFGYIRSVHLDPRTKGHDSAQNFKSNKLPHDYQSRQPSLHQETNLLPIDDHNMLISEQYDLPCYQEANWTNKDPKSPLYYYGCLHG